MIAASDPPEDVEKGEERSSRPGSAKGSRPNSRTNSRAQTPTQDLTEEIVLNKKKTEEKEKPKPKEEPKNVQQTVGQKKENPASGIAKETKKATVTPVGKPSSKVSPLATMQKKLNFIPKNQRGALNTEFLATVPGVLKIAEIVLGFVTFILAICADRNSTSSSFAEHISFEATIIAGILLLGYVIFPHLTLDEEKNRNGLVVLELIFYAINTVAYFICIWLMVHLSATWRADGRGAAIMSAILDVALTVLFGIETFIKYKAVKGEQIGQKPVDNGHYSTNATLSPDPENV